MTKYIDKIRKEFNNTRFPIFTLRDIRILLSKTQVSQRYLKIMLNNLLKKGEIRRITLGVYTFQEDITVVGFAYKPFYYGLEDALSYRNFWNQSTNPIVMTPNFLREGLRKFETANYLIKRVKPKFFFGFDFIKYYDIWIPVSDPEKTLIDLVYYKHGIRSDALKLLIKAIDRNKLDEYLKIYGKGLRQKVLVILNETVT